MIHVSKKDPILLVASVQLTGSLARYERVGCFSTDATLHAAARDGMVACLAAFGRAGGLVDEDWKVLAMNAAGLALIGQVLQSRDCRLTGTTLEIDLRLQRFKRSMESADKGVAVFERERGSKLVARATRLPVPIGQAAMILTFEVAGERELAREAVLRDAFGLTATEACVALAIAKGSNLRDIARSRGVAIDTVRSHLRIIFAKTATRRQASLVVLIASLHENAKEPLPACFGTAAE